MAKRSNYKRYGRRTEPKCVRFDKDVLPIVLERSGANTVQQLVDFLVNQYYFGQSPVEEKPQASPPSEKKEAAAKAVTSVSSFLEQRRKKVFG